MMQAIDLIKFSRETLKSLSKIGVKIDDFKHIEMYHEYLELKDKGYKKEYIKAKLANKYKTSESSIYRIVRRLNKQVKI